ncbi:MAG TPA: hypothetical protein VNN25_22115 [Thermoanaerobaculia bacterium]|nr:hypothetical protein [Thermoanaerobaculia bacterium]
MQTFHSPKKSDAGIASVAEKASDFFRAVAVVDMKTTFASGFVGLADRALSILLDQHGVVAAERHPVNGLQKIVRIPALVSPAPRSCASGVLFGKGKAMLSAGFARAHSAICGYFAGGSLVEFRKELFGLAVRTKLVSADEFWSDHGLVISNPRS